MKLFSKTKSERTVGIDVGTSAIKVAELEWKGDSVFLSNYAQFSAKSGISAGGGSPFGTLDSQIATILKDVLKTANINTNKAAVSVPVFSSFSTLIEIPAIGEDELDKAIRYEARKFIPIPMGEVQFDWAKIDHLSSDKTFKILTAAVPHEIVNKYYRIAKMLNIEITFLELETFSAARSLVSTTPEVILVLDIGGRTTNAGIIDGGMVVMHHNIDLGGTAFTRVLSRGMSIATERAEDIKRTEGFNASNGQASELFQPTVDKVILEMEQMMDDYMREGGKKITKIILSGGGGKLIGLPEYMQKTLNIPVELGNPFQLVKTPSKLGDVLKKNYLELTTAIGLALRNEE
ncbi:MAG: type IV pilus assembly protein PilM [Candidatus Spechtbacterales bacterium]|nr:type IV pilus assembly protein PilM [Candidatus Spechtbacterales bacterium]